MLPATNKGVGTNTGFPDVCNTPVGSGTAPVPYPNIGMTSMASPFALTVKICMVAALNMLAKISTTSGMEAGTAHATIKGVGAYTMGNPTVLIEKSAAINLTCPTTGNNMNNALGAVTVPSVANVLFTRLPQALPATGERQPGGCDAVELSLDLLESLDAAAVDGASGLGLCLRQEASGVAEVVHVRRGGAGHRIGLRAGDRITLNTVTPDADSASSLSLSVFRDAVSFPVEVPLTTAPPVARMRSMMLAGTAGARIGYIEPGPFSLDTSTRLFNAVRRLGKTGVDSMLLDLRGNPGGELAGALRLADDFLVAGSTLCRQRDAHGETLHRGRNRRPYEHPVTLLVDGGTASAAEVFAGALQHHARATLVGECTFGKGRAQGVCSGEERGSLYATVAEIRLPDGRPLEGVGLRPEVELPGPREDAEAFARLAPQRAAAIATESLAAWPDGGATCSEEDLQLAAALRVASPA